MASNKTLTLKDKKALVDETFKLLQQLQKDIAVNVLQMKKAYDANVNILKDILEDGTFKGDIAVAVKITKEVTIPAKDEYLQTRRSVELLEKN